MEWQKAASSPRGWGGSPPERQTALYSMEFALTLSGLWVSEWVQCSDRSVLWGVEAGVSAWGTQVGRGESCHCRGASLWQRFSRSKEQPSSPSSILTSLFPQAAAPVHLPGQALPCPSSSLVASAKEVAIWQWDGEPRRAKFLHLRRGLLHVAWALAMTEARDREWRSSWQANIFLLCAGPRPVHLGGLERNKTQPSPIRVPVQSKAEKAIPSATNNLPQDYRKQPSLLAQRHQEGFMEEATLRWALNDG